MTTIITKNSSTASATPAAGDLTKGELAVNVTDKKLYTKDNSGTVVKVVGSLGNQEASAAAITGGTSAGVAITGGTINNTPIGATTAAAITGTTVTATTGFVGALTGAVTGNTTGTHTGNVTGDVTGNLTGNVTASTGTSSFNDVTINGGLNMNAGTAATITNLTAPTNANDAATKSYVDTSISNLVASAPSTLDTLNEIAAALGNDPNLSTTLTTSIATKLPLAGGTMSGNIAMGSNKVTGLGTPSAGTDAATKTYVDGVGDAKLALSGGTMTGNIVMGANKVTSTATPTASSDLTTKTYVDSILGSATSAATSASAAATSATNAANSASAASTSASDASASASAAAASYDSFDDRYLGSKSTAPTVDNDGNALLTGALYWNTATNTLYVWTGSTWTQAAFTSGGFLVNSNNLSDVSSVSTARTNLGLGTAATMTGPSGTIVGTTDTQTLTNKTLTSPTLTTPVLGTPASGTLTNATGLPLSTGVTGTLPIANGGTGATTLAGANIPVTNVANSFTGTQTFSGTSSAIAAVLNDAAEVATVSATAATGTINYDITTQSVLYYTSNASANWTVNFRGSSGTSLNTLMSTGQSMTVAFLVTQGSTAYYNSAVQVDGTTTGVTTRWLGGAPTAGNASGIDSYRYLIIKTGAATFTVLASNTQFKA